MPDENNTSKDRDLLARLNALKKSHVNLEAKTYPVSTVPPPLPIDPAPAQALHTDLLARFKSLAGNSAINTETTQPSDDSATHQFKEEDDKTIEELLADLGPAEQWSVEKSEADNVADLLRSANVALSTQPELEHIPVDKEEEEDARLKNDENKPGIYKLPSIDVEVFKPEPDTDDEEDPQQSRKTKKEISRDIDAEADEVLKRLLDEVQYESQQPQPQDQHQGEGDDDEEEEEPPPYFETDASRNMKQSNDNPSTTKATSSSLLNFNLPTTPSKDPLPLPSTNDDADLSARFANLSLPSAPTSAPVSKSKSSSAKPKPVEKFTDEQIDSWCIICLSDATLECIGCDGDLYCAKCWIEGHRGPDVGFEERTHRAKEFGKKKGKKKLVGVTG